MYGRDLSSTEGGRGAERLLTAKQGIKSKAGHIKRHGSVW